MKCHNLAWLAVSAGLLLSTAWADEVVMKNGDRVTGVIIKQDGKTITVKTDNFGIVTAPWDKVASLKSDQPVHVVLKDGKTLVGTVAPSDGKVEIAAADTKLDVSPGEIAAIRDADEQKAYERLLNPGLLQLWSGGGSVGWAGTSGNAKTTTFTTAFNAARVTNTDKISLDFNLIKASALISGQTASTAQAVRGGIGYDHNVSPRLFVTVFNDYEYDRFQPGVSRQQRPPFVLARRAALGVAERITGTALTLHRGPVFTSRYDARVFRGQWVPALAGLDLRSAAQRLP